jgi:shikimate 5-dehydrogenase
LRAYELVFDAVYTPRNTRLLQEAAEVGAIVVSGVEMFIRQALGQFRLFTGGLGTGLPIMSNHQFINLTRVFYLFIQKISSTKIQVF